MNFEILFYGTVIGDSGGRFEPFLIQSVYLIQETVRIELFWIFPNERIPMKHVNQNSDGAALRDGQPVNDFILFNFSKVIIIVFIRTYFQVTQHLNLFDLTCIDLFINL